MSYAYHWRFSWFAHTYHFAYSDTIYMYMHIRSIGVKTLSISDIFHSCGRTYVPPPILHPIFFCKKDNSWRKREVLQAKRGRSSGCSGARSFRACHWHRLAIKPSNQQAAIFGRTTTFADRPCPLYFFCQWLLGTSESAAWVPFT